MKSVLNTNKLVKLIAIPALMLGLTSAQAAVTITGTDDFCTSRSDSPHASTIMFFGDDIRNVVATNNEFQIFQEGGDNPIFQDTNMTLDVWSEGTCVGSILVTIDAATNERAEVIIEDHLNTPNSGVGVLVRTGKLDVRSKIDTYIDTGTIAGNRRIIWNNFTGIPNNSRLMSGMRVAAGQHLAAYYTGADATATAQIQMYNNEGEFIGVTEQIMARHAAVITNDVLSLSYKDLEGNAVDASKLPKDGEGYIRIRGNEMEAIGASCMILFTKAKPDVAGGAWSNDNLSTTTITYARRNGDNDPLAAGE
ncbi:MAG: hypothetical protein DRQ78_12380 [Epsilonproteobacteria bacterium]|nr:MAG: hypothetical protein DRQ78_12380 [Campylobacterota bacterium]